jgi:hypothetical protein
VPFGKIKIFRDKDKSGIRTVDTVFVSSGFGINRQSGLDTSVQSIEKGPSANEHFATLYFESLTGGVSSGTPVPGCWPTR